MKEILVSSLCCGIGLMDLGFNLKNKFKIVYAADTDDASVRVYSKNVSTNVVKKSIVDIKAEDIPKCDLLIGELPAIMSSNKDTQTLLIDNFIRIVKETSVNGFVMVTYLFNEGDSIKDEIEKETGYKVSVKKVNFSDFGSGVKKYKHVVIGMKEKELNLNDYSDFIDSIPNKTIMDALTDADKSSNATINFISDDELRKHEGFLVRLSENDCFNGISKDTWTLGRALNDGALNLDTANNKHRAKNILIHPKLNRSFTREELLSGLGLSENNLGFKFDLLDDKIKPLVQERLLAKACSYDFSNNLAKIVEDFYMKNCR